jgi:hypothetical protein
MNIGPYYRRWLELNEPSHQSLRTASRDPRSLPLKDEHIQTQHDSSHRAHLQSIKLGATCPDDDAQPKDASTRLLRAASAIIARRGVGSVVSATPDPYRAATAKGQELRAAMSPDVFPNYDPHGRPADPYAIALAHRNVKAEDAGQRAAARPATVLHRDDNGVPNPYSPTAIAAAAARR